MSEPTSRSAPESRVSENGQQWIDRARKILVDVEASYDERHRMEQENPRYQPPQFGTIDSSAYLLNLKACLGQTVPHLLRVIDALTTADSGGLQSLPDSAASPVPEEQPNE